MKSLAGMVNSCGCDSTRSALEVDKQRYLYRLTWQQPGPVPLGDQKTSGVRQNPAFDKALFNYYRKLVQCTYFTSWSGTVRSIV